MAATATARRRGGREAVLSWAVEVLEIRRLLHHQIDATFIPDNTASGGHWQIAADAQADQSNEPAEAPPDGFVPGSAIPAVALPGLPALNSDTSAHAAIYLDFNGDAGGQTAYDEDNDPTTFNATEAAHITAAWKSISTYFASFDVNVTTIKPATAVPTAWGMIGNSIQGGYSYVGVFPNVQKFGGPGSFNESSDARGRTSGMAHEYGHNFGLSHQSDYDSLGIKTKEYSSGYDVTHGPIMGVDFDQNVHKWFIGHPSTSNNTLQDDVAIIANAIKSAVGLGDGFRADDYGNTIATATALQVEGAGLQDASGIIERMSDVDAFSFTADAAGEFAIQVNPTGPSALAPKVEVYDSAGHLIAAKDDTDQRNGNNNDETFDLGLAAPGTYYVLVKSHGDYGDIGQYTVSARNLPDGWLNQDVGGPVTAGSSQYDAASDTYTIAGAGTDIWGTGDQFQFAYQTLSGDGSITARVASLTNTAASAKAGVMIRESLNGNSRHALVAIDPPSRGLEFIYRTATGGSAAETQVAGLVAPYWVRLTRTGNVLKAERSADGVTWTTVGQQTISMASKVYIGLAVCSVNKSALNTATFDNVSLTGNVNPTAGLNALAAPTGLTVAPGTGTGLTLNWADSGPDATGYAIDRSIDGANWTQIGTVGAGVTTYGDNGLFGAMRYFYRVAALDATGRSVASDVATAVNRPNAPASLTTESISTSQIVVNWRDVSGDTGYKIERSADGGTTWTQIATVGTNVPSYTDSGLTVATQYQYRVTALSPQGTSPVSATITASTRLPATTGLAFTNKASNSMAIKWNAVTGATNYKIERSTDGATFTTLATVASTVLAYTDNAVAALGEYYYRVEGTNSLTQGVNPAAIFAAAPASPASVLPAPWQAQDVGSPAGSGATGYAGSTFTVVANGNDIWNASDQFRFTYMPLVGDGQIVARVNTLENTDGWAKAGVMIRDSLSGNARDVFVAVSPSNGLQMLDRTTVGGAAAQVGSTITGKAAPYWVKLVRSGNSFAGYVSADNITWTQIGTTVSVTMASSVYVGLALTSHTTTTLNTAKFDNVTASNTAPTVAVAAAATPNPVTGKTATVSVFGADDHGEANLTYTWAATATPAGGGVTFSANVTNFAKSATATFTKAGVYTLTCTIKDTSGLTVASSVDVTVSQTLTSIAVAPSTATITAGQTQQFTASALDQFGDPLAAQPPFNWSVSGAGGDATVDATGLLSTGATAAGPYTVTAGANLRSGSASVTVNAVTVAATIAGRHLFYNTSMFDGGDPAATDADDAAVAPGVVALRPGEASSAANLSGYSRGINGIMVDIAGLPAAANLTAADFGFAVGTAGDPSTWAAGPAPASITVRHGKGAGGSDRVTVIWADNAIQDEWLAVTVNANANTGLAAADVFYFGSLVGDTGDNGTATAVVDAADTAAVRAQNAQAADVTSSSDLNHNGMVTATDIALTRLNAGHSLGMFTAPAPAPAPAAAPAAAVAAAPAEGTRAAATTDLAAAAPAVASDAVALQSTAAVPPARKTLSRRTTRAVFSIASMLPPTRLSDVLLLARKRTAVFED
jgi:regulation of enolase protein 1 (concanavalin A-like superfamily)/plastocyanin